MTLLRKLAIAISEATVRWSSPGCKPWAEGLAHEVQFIPTDWRALAWSLGGLRVLFCSPPSPLGTPEEIAQAGRIYAGNREHVPPVVAFLCATQVLYFGFQAVLPIGHPDPIQRTGFLVAAMSAAYLAVITWLQTRMVPRPEDMDDSAWIEFYRSEMVRVRDLFTGVGSMFRPAAISFLAGATLGRIALKFEPWPVLTVCAPLALVLWLNLHPAERFQRKIDQLDSALRRCGVSQ